MSCILHRWVVTVGLVVSTSAAAHHSTSMYDYSKTVMLTATVRQFQWTNPHCFVQVTAPDERGKEVEWAIETGTPVINASKGWNKNSLKPGDKVSLVISPLRDGSPGGTLRTVTLPDGKVLSGAAADFSSGPPKLP